ncbi:hypothetical protein BH11ACT2_BH11ACT2_21620 [soil metagenome]
MHLPSTRRGKVAIATLAGFALVAAPLAAAPAFAADSTITLLNINDFHGRINTDTIRFAGTIEQLRAAGGEGSTALLSAGDNLGASEFASAVQNDEPTIDVLNELELQASAVGNHEFDKGVSDLTGRIDDRADWQYLGANVYKAGTNKTVPAFDGPQYKVITLGGVKVAVIGAVTEETPTLVSPAGVSTLEFGDPVDAVNRVVGQLDALDPADRPDVYVAEYHEGAKSDASASETLDAQVAESAVFSKIVNGTSPEVDAIFTGHTHKAYAYNAPVAGGGTRPVVQTGEYGGNVGKVTLTVDPGTDIVSAHTQELVKRLAAPADTPAADLAAANAAIDTQLVGQYPRVANVKTIVDAALAYAKQVGGQKIGSVTRDITTAFIGTERDDRASESTLGNLVADALVDTLKQPLYGSAEIGVVNPGGLRADLTYASSTANEGDGVVTYGEANSVLPFVNNLWTTSLTGAQFKTVLEQQWQTTATGTVPSRSYLQLGLSKNVTYTYDPNAARGSHITSISVNGAPIDPTKSYRIGTFSFLTSGGDNFRELAKGTGAKDTGLVDRDVWISYITKSSPLSPSYARHSVAVGALPTGVVPQGTTGTIDVAKLDLTSLGSPKNTSITATFAGSKAKGITSAVTDGAATVKYRVPFDTPANATLVLTASPSGTEVRIPIVTSIAIDSNKPKIDGDPKVGATLHARVGVWDPAPVSMSYRWFNDGKPIKGATSKTYKVKASDKGDKLTFRAVGTKKGYPTVTRYSDAVKIYLAIKKHPRPTITGTAKVGHTLHVIAHKWTPTVSHSYRWYRSGVAISGATHKAYKLTSKDRGKKITVKVYGSKTGYFTETETRSVARIR